MEKIPVPPPGPPLESTSSVEQTAHPPKPAPRTRHITVECGTYNHQQSPGPQHHGSRPMENIPVPPYPGPPLESVQQSAYNHQPPPQIHHTTAEGGPGTHLHSTGPQHHSSLPMENIPVPPYPGPPLDSEQHRTFTPQPTPQIQHIPSEGGSHIHLHPPGPQRQSSVPTENLPVRQYSGPPLGFDSTSSLEQRAYSHQPDINRHHPISERGTCNHQQSPGPQHHGSRPMENIPVPPYPGPPLESVQQRAYNHQPPPQIHHTTAEGGPGTHLHSTGPQHHSSLPMENIPVPPYPGPPLDSEQHRTFTPQPTPQHIPSQGGSLIHLHPPGPQRQSSVHTENLPVRQYSGPPLGFDCTSSLEQRAYSHQPDINRHHPISEGIPCSHMLSPHPQHPCQHFELSGTSGKPRPECKGALNHQPPPYTHHEIPEGVHCQHSCKPNFSSQPANHSPAYMGKEKATLSMYPEKPLVYPSQKSQGCMQENMFAQPDSPHKNCTSIQGNHLSLDVTRKIKFEIARESESLEQKIFTHVHHPQVEPLCSSQNTTEFSRHTTEYMKVSTNNVSSRAVQQIIPDTSASMYNIYPNGALQPRVQVVQSGRSHVIIQPQSPAVVVQGMAPQAIIQPSQPAVMIQPAAPTVRVIQPQVLPTVIQQPAANTIVYRHY